MHSSIDSFLIVPAIVSSKKKRNYHWSHRTHQHAGRNRSSLPPSLPARTPAAPSSTRRRQNRFASH